MEKFGENFDKFITPLKFPKLKKLIINFDVFWVYKIACLDFTSCSETLESLELHFFPGHFPRDCQSIEEHYFASYSEMRNLNTLTFCNYILGITTPDLEHLKKCKSLRLD